MGPLPVGFVNRADRCNLRVEEFLHGPHVRILGSLLGGDLSPFRLLLGLLAGRCCRRYAADLNFQGDGSIEMLLQRHFQALLNGFGQHLSMTGFQGQPEMVACAFDQCAIERDLFGDAAQSQLFDQGAPFRNGLGRRWEGLKWRGLPECQRGRGWRWRGGLDGGRW